MARGEKGRIRVIVDFEASTGTVASRVLVAGRST